MRKKNIKQNNISKSRLSGHITVYAALSLMLVMSLVCTCIKSAEVSYAKASVDTGCVLAEEAVFAGYCNKLLEEYDIFALKKSDIIDKKLDWFINANTENIEGVEWISSSIDNYSFMTDDSGVNLYNQVSAYMKYGICSDILKNIVGTQEETRSSKAIAEITDSFVECQDKIFEQDKEVLRLVELTEGIRTNNTGFEVSSDKPVCTGEYFAKAALSRNISMESTAIDNKVVYAAVYSSDKLVDICELLKDIKEDVEVFVSIAEEENEEIAKEDCESVYKSNCQKLKTVINGVKEKLLQAIEQTNKISEQRENTEEDISSFSELLESKKSDIKQDLYEKFSSDIAEMQQDNKQGNSICDVAIVKEGLIHNKNIVESVCDEINNIPEELHINISNEIIVELEDYLEILRKLDNSKMKFDYSNISFEEKKSGINKIKKLYDNMKKGVAGIVIGDRNVSEKTIDINNLADKDMPESNHYDLKNKFLLSGVTEAALFNEYLLNKFDSYVDCDNNQEKEDDGKLLNYPLEYILCGKKSDRDNLEDIIMQLSLIREGANMTYLITNAGKRSEAMEMAVCLVGFTGNMAVVKAAQYVIMAAWAYGEAIIDIRKLLDNKKVSLIKNDLNWELSLENLLAMEFSSNESDNKTSDEAGIDYEGYIRMLLLLENTVKKCYRTMAAMEIRMIEEGDSEFRMRNYICGLKGSAEFKILQTGQKYNQNLEYCYY